MGAFVVDANVMNYFQRERVTEQGEAHIAISRILEQDFIALDEEGFCRQEWLECAEGTFPLALSDWVNDQLVYQKIQIHPLGSDPDFNSLRVLGIPKKDHKWVKLAVSVNAVRLVTEDIDLIEPSKKNCTRQTREKIKDSCRGSVAKALLRKYGVKIACCRHIPSMD